MDAEMEALVVERGDGVAHDLIREFEDGFLDQRVGLRQFGAREAIATSTGQNDAGLFLLDLNDERYLPFEYAGAVSRWRTKPRCSRRCVSACVTSLGPPRRPSCVSCSRSCCGAEDAGRRGNSLLNSAPQALGCKA